MAFCLTKFKTHFVFNSGPSIAIHIRCDKLSSDSLLRSLVFISFIWLNDLSAVAVPTERANITSIINKGVWFMLHANYSPPPPPPPN